MEPEWMARVVLPSFEMTSASDSSVPYAAPTRSARGGPENAISFVQVSKRFPAAEGGWLEVLRDVSFEVPLGAIVAILGPSGSGKSTLLNLAAGLLAADAGGILVLGERTDGAVDWNRLGYMFQDDRLLPWRVAIQNVSLALEAGDMPADERLRRARAALDLVGLGGFPQAYPHQLSGGMRSRVALARSLVSEPEVLLMDEPFSRLDAQTRGSMHRELLRIHAMRPLSILFVTHDVEEAVVLADRVVLMSARPGRVRRAIDVSLPHPRIATPQAISLIAELRASLEAEPPQEAQR
jgi:NitT/TauT family transport system ATP-binding protein